MPNFIVLKIRLQQRFQKMAFDFEICFKDTEYTRTTLRGNQ